MARTFTSLLTHTVFSTSGRVPSLTGVIPPGGGSQSPSTLLYDSAGDVTSDSHTGNQYVYEGSPLTGPRQRGGRPRMAWAVPS